ncbi:MAG: hypothetical protein JWQ09_3602 [Segetibacter sp.]|nr:hypothetical protein [Segetibacter sp.]
MTRSYSHVNTAKAILNLYKGEMPFNAFLKSFFQKKKNMEAVTEEQSVLYATITSG